MGFATTPLQIIIDNLPPDVSIMNPAGTNPRKKRSGSSNQINVYLRWDVIRRNDYSQVAAGIICFTSLLDKRTVRIVKPDRLTLHCSPNICEDIYRVVHSGMSKMPVD